LNILVTGGGGYVGSRLIRSLLDGKHKITILDLMMFGRDHLADLESNPNVTIIEDDIRNDDAVNKALQGIDSVVHLAGMANDPSCELEPRMSWQVNLEAPILFAEQSREAGVKRFIYASSTSVYGFFEKGEATEETPLNPLSLYAELKAAVEHILMKRSTKTFEVVSLRPATICGYSPRLRLDLVLNTFAKQAWFDGEITVFGGSQMRPNLTIADMVRAYEHVLNADSDLVAGEVFNVSAENMSVMDLAYLTRDTVRPDAKIRVIDEVDPRSYRVNSSKILDRIGYEPQQSLSDALLEIRDSFESGEISNPDAPIYRNVDRVRELQKDKVTD